MKPKLALIHRRDVSEETVQALSYLLREAKAGHVSGLAFVAFHNGYQFSTGVIGRSRELPTLTRGMVKHLDDEVACLYDEYPQQA